MRNKQVMFDLILEVAQKDNRILGVYLNGSRANTKVKADIFQDYDIVYVVKETKPFIEEKQWIDVFGERLYMQYPDKHSERREIVRNYGWLIQLKDGNRLDLHVSTLDYALMDLHNDSLVTILLDKQGLFPQLPPASDVNYFVKKPLESEYLSVCNEFWWCLNNVAKGCFREEWTYVQDMLNLNVRPQIFTLLTWLVGTQTNFSISVGKSGKYMKQYLPLFLWENYLKTYSNCDGEAIWKAVFLMCDLMDSTALAIAAQLNFHYDLDEAKASRGYLDHVHALAKDASEVYAD